MRTSLPLARNLDAALFGRLSVVMMARLNSAKARALFPRARTNFGTALTIFCHRSGTPITPVEQTRICVGRSFPNSLATLRVVAVAAVNPSEPVQQLAFPEFTMTPRISVRDFFRWSCEVITGAALTRLVVKTAAAMAGVSLTINPRSSPDFFRPHATEEYVKPRGTSAFEIRCEANDWFGTFDCRDFMKFWCAKLFAS